MSSLNIRRHAPPTSAETLKNVSGLPQSLWQQIAHFLPPTECTHTMPTVCSLLKDVKPYQGALDLSERPITGQELLLRVKQCQAPIETLKVSNCTKLTDDDLKFLAQFSSLRTLDLSGCIGITQKGVEYLLLNTQITHLTLPSLDMGESLLNDAVAKSDEGLLKRVLSIGIPPQFPASIAEGGMTPLYFATKNEDVECVKLLLQAGADPTIPFYDDTLEMNVTPYEFAIGCKNPRLASLYSAFSSTKLRIFSPYSSADFGAKTVKCFLNPLFKPAGTVKSFIKPIQTFVAKETERDPDFAVYIVPQPLDEPSLMGDYSHDLGTINLYVKDQRKPRSKPTPLLHEISHKAVDKIGWTQSQKNELMEQVSKDIETLKLDRWQSCDPAIATLYKDVDKYAPEKRFEEYLVRIPEIVTLMAKKPKRSSRGGIKNRLMGQKPSPQSIEKRLQEAIPHLYAIYTEKFLPQLEEYNRSS